MDPRRAGLQALLAAERARRHDANLGLVAAGIRHHTLLEAAMAAGWPASARKACSAATTCAPSPTAAATRLTDPARTSPIANTPGRLVSSGLRMLAPVRTKPLSSSLTPEPDNQVGFASAPLNKDRWPNAR